MLMRASFVLLVGCALAAGVVVDRVAVIVGKHVIKNSDIERDLRSTAFLNRERLDLSEDARRKAAERLIDQSLIRDEIETGEYSQSNESELEAMLKRLQQERFGGSTSRMKEEAARYGLTDEQLRRQLQWQLTVLKFIDQRFRPGVMVADEEVRAYYDQHAAELRRQFPQAKTFEALEPKIRESLEGERISKAFEQWLGGARKRSRIEYRQEAFHEQAR
jgi:hypothetical protein